MYTRGLLSVSVLSAKLHTVSAYVVMGTGDVSYVTNNLQLSNVTLDYPD